jgi:hypothetical protein
LFAVRAPPPDRNESEILADVDPFHLHRPGRMITKCVLDVHEDVYNIRINKTNWTILKASNQEKNLKDLNVSIRAYAEI